MFLMLRLCKQKRFEMLYNKREMVNIYLCNMFSEADHHHASFPSVPLYTASRLEIDLFQDLLLIFTGFTRRSFSEGGLSVAIGARKKVSPYELK